MRLPACVLAAGLVLIALATAPALGGAQTERAPTFSETIAPIVYQHCVECHRADGPAPFALVNYEDIARRGTLIAEVTKSRYMPPWHAAPGAGEFVGERRLTDRDIALLGEWVRTGMARGNPGRMPALPSFPDGWPLGPPDLILQMPAGFDVPASGPDVYRNFVLPTGLTQDRWVRAVALRPRSRRAVHHALFAYTRGGSMSKRDGADGRPGFGGSMAIGVLPGPGGSGSLGGWAVGGGAMVFPAGLSPTLPAGSDLLLQVHFHPSGRAEVEQAAVGLYFADEAPTKAAASIELPALFGFGAGIDIPAGERRYTVRDEFTLLAVARVHSAWVHAHYLGKEMTLEAVLPDGLRKPLLRVEEWDFNWQEFYTYKAPVDLPAGTRLEATLVYDNSSDNGQNPHSPPQRVQWGLESTDEMGTIGVLVEVPDPRDLPALRQALEERAKRTIGAGVADGTVRRYLAQQAAMEGR